MLLYLYNFHDSSQIKFSNVIGLEECLQHNLKVKNLQATFMLSNSYCEKHRCIYRDKERKIRSLKLVAGCVLVVLAASLPAGGIHWLPKINKILKHITYFITSIAIDLGFGWGEWGGNNAKKTIFIVS